MNARVYEGCIGCGLCVMTCPAVFRMKEDGVSEAYAEIPKGEEEHAAFAVQGCPVGVISIER